MQSEIRRAINSVRRMGFGVKSIVLNPLAGTIEIVPMTKETLPASVRRKLASAEA
jgi:hypothetical protein